VPARHGFASLQRHLSGIAGAKVLLIIKREEKKREKLKKKCLEGQKSLSTMRLKGLLIYFFKYEY